MVRSTGDYFVFKIQTKGLEAEKKRMAWAYLRIAPMVVNNLLKSRFSEGEDWEKAASRAESRDTTITISQKRPRELRSRTEFA